MGLCWYDTILKETNIPCGPELKRPTHSWADSSAPDRNKSEEERGRIGIGVQWIDLAPSQVFVGNTRRRSRPVDRREIVVALVIARSRLHPGYL
jgi:hypothetical protein